MSDRTLTMKHHMMILAHLTCSTRRSHWVCGGASADASGSIPYRRI